MDGWTYLAGDELEITGALGVAVTRAVLGTSGVAGVLGLATIKVHGDKVQSTVQAASVKTKLVRDLDHPSLLSSWEGGGREGLTASWRRRRRR